MSDIDLRELLDSWLIALRAEGKSPNTIRAYGIAVRAYLKDHDTLDRGQVRQWLTTIPNPSTANLRCRAVQAFARWLHDEGETEVDLLAGVKAPKPADRLVESVSVEELTKLRRACTGNGFLEKRDTALLEFGLSTGARAEEVLSLKVADIDLKQMTAIIQRGKGGRPRIVSFDYTAAKALDRYLRIRRRHQYADSPWLWISDRTSHFTWSGLEQAMHRRADDAGVTGFHYHRLRHTMASDWLSRGGSEGGLMRQAGWRSYRMIQRYTEDRANQIALEEARRIQGIVM